MYKIVRKYFFLSIAVLLLLGCSTARTKIQPSEYDNKNSARLRVFGNNGIGMVIYPNMNECPKSSDNGLRVSGKIQQSLNAFLSQQDNISIGMPISDRVKNPYQSIFGNDFYTESIIPAKPITIQSTFTSADHSYCKPITVTFFPEAGKDYETVLNIDKIDRYCQLKILRIDNDGNSFEDVKTSYYPQCKAPKFEFLKWF